MRNWSQHEYKRLVRDETIIDLYIDRYSDPLHESKQYWSLCGECTNEGKKHDGSELGQLLKRKFITPEQFHGADYDAKIIARNKKAYPKANWYADDLFSAMCNVDEFNPGLINFDSINTPPIAIPVLSDIIGICPPNTMVVCNMVMKYRGLDYNIDDVVNELNKLDLKKTVKHHKELMSYKNGNTIMGTIVCFT
jgi:hypothetical protein